MITHDFISGLSRYEFEPLINILHNNYYCLVTVTKITFMYMVIEKWHTHWKRVQHNNVSGKVHIVLIKSDLAHDSTCSIQYPK